MPDEFKLMEGKAPFNMAINTLERLGEILREIKNNSSNQEIDLGTKQAIKVSLIRQFFMQSYPLLDENIADKYLSEFGTMTIEPVKVIMNNNGMKQRTNSMKYIFDKQLDVKLDSFLMKIQRELQREKYFMPPKKDMGSAVGHF